MTRCGPSEQAGLAIRNVFPFDVESSDVNLQLIAVLCFAGIASVVGAVLLVIRDLRRSPNDGDVRLSKSRLLQRRARTVFDEKPAGTLAGKIDQSFDHLVLESGMDMVPMAGFLLLLAIGLTIGGCLFVSFEDPILGSAGMAIAMLATLGFVHWRRVRRMRSMCESFPHAVDLMARAVRAGESVDQALSLVACETAGPLGDELGTCSRQVEMGLSISGAMQNLARRVRLRDIRMLSTTLMVHRKSGGNLPQALERLATMVQNRLSDQRKLRAASGAGRSSAMLIGIISPLVYLFVFIWQPEHVRILFTEPLGQMLLVLAFVLELIGIIWVATLLKQEY